VQQVVVSSPHSCALQTAMVACDQLTEGPIIVHPDLKHIKKDLTLGGQFPEGKPKFQGLSASTLQAALTRQPFAHAASRVDLSMLDEVHTRRVLLPPPATPPQLTHHALS
jgi:hypothetical protein